MAADPARKIKQNLQGVQAAMERAAGGRNVRLVCVTKYAHIAWVQALLEAGATELGENLLPRAQERFMCFNSFGFSFTRHLLGAQQSRKVKDVPAACDLFQALDRNKTASLLQESVSTCAATLDVLLEVNIDHEANKPGWQLELVESAVSQLSTEFPALRLRGLMCLPQRRISGEGAAKWESRTRGSFARLARQFARIPNVLPRTAQWDTLSMGMSQDFAWAIEEGATMVRVGSALFAGLEG